MKNPKTIPIIVVITSLALSFDRFKTPLKKQFKKLKIGPNSTSIKQQQNYSITLNNKIQKTKRERIEFPTFDVV